MAVAGADGAVRLWDAADQAASWTCALATPGITLAEWNRYLPGIPYPPPCPGTP